MRHLVLSAFCLAAVVVSASGAASAGDAKVTMCIRHHGSLYNVHCMRSKPGKAVCDCGSDYHVAVPICGAAEQPAPSNAEASKARFAAAAAGNLDTATYEGRRFCLSLLKPGGRGFGSSDLTFRDSGTSNMRSVQSSQGQANH